MTYYVESGITGSITANSTYCCCGTTHSGHTGWYNQTDWATWNGGTQRIECAPGAGINSVRTFIHSSFGCSDCGSGPQKDAVEVHFYTSNNGSGTPVAKVLYFHVDSDPRFEQHRLRRFRLEQLPLGRLGTVQHLRNLLLGCTHPCCDGLRGKPSLRTYRLQ